MPITNYEPMFVPVEVFISRFFQGNDLIFEQETKMPLPTMCKDDNIEIFDKEYLVEKRMFAFHEDAFMTIYYLRSF
jgi:hypothetical protein